MLSSIKNIIFDLGGVMVDLDRQCCIDSFKRIGFAEANKYIDSYHPVEFFGLLERGAISREEFCDKIRAIAACDIAEEDIEEAYSNFLVEIPIYKLRLLASLRKQGYKIYALSNINPMVMNKVRKLFAADGMTMEDYFDHMYLSFEMGCLKPEDQIYEMLIEHSGIETSETLFIDDSQRNIEAGQKFGLQVYLAEAHEDYSHIFDPCE